MKIINKDILYRAADKLKKEKEESKGDLLMRFTSSSYIDNSYSIEIYDNQIELSHYSSELKQWVSKSVIKLNSKSGNPIDKLISDFRQIADNKYIEFSRTTVRRSGVQVFEPKPAYLFDEIIELIKQAMVNKEE